MPSRLYVILMLIGLLVVSGCTTGTTFSPQILQQELQQIQAEERDVEQRVSQGGGFTVLAGSRSDSVSKSMVPSQKMNIQVVTPERGRLYVRYYQNGQWYRKWTSFSRGTTVIYDFTEKTRYLYVYAYVYKGSVDVREGPIASPSTSSEPSSSPTPSISTATSLSSVLSQKGISLVGDQKEESGVPYYSTINSGVAGRAYLHTSGSLKAYVENPLLTAYLQDGGVQRLGIPLRDQHTLHDGGARADYITTSRGAYVYSYLSRKGLYLPQSVANQFFSKFSHIGVPLSIEGSKVLTSKGLLDLGTSKVSAHTEVENPLRTMRMSQRFQGLYKAPSRHSGGDYAVPENTPVYAIANGRVALTSTGYTGGWGTVIKIEHIARRKGGAKLYSLYAHLNRLLVRPGQLVAKGDIIGLSGNTGDSSGPHLHLGIFDDRVPNFGLGYSTASLPALGYLDPQEVLARPEQYLE